MYANHLGAFVIIEPRCNACATTVLKKLLLRAVTPKVQFLEELNRRNTLQKLAPIFQLIRSKTKTNCDLFEHIFMHVVTARRKFYISSSFDCIVFVPCDCLE